MHFIFTLAALLPLALAAPTSTGRLQSRTPGNVYLCTGANFTGECDNFAVPLQDPTQNATCHTLPSPWYQNLGSARPDTGALCRLYAAACQEDDMVAFLQSPGTADLFTTDTGLDAGATATRMLCQECTNCT